MQNNLWHETLAGRAGSINGGDFLGGERAVIDREVVNSTGEKESATAIFDVTAQNQGAGIIRNRAVGEPESDRDTINVKDLFFRGIIERVGKMIQSAQRGRERAGKDHAKATVVANSGLEEAVVEPDSVRVESAGAERLDTHDADSIGGIEHEPPFERK